MELMQHLPSFYYNSEEVINIEASIDAEKEEVYRNIEDLLKQLFVESATWGLDQWERYLGLKIDHKESYANRRSRVLTRLRGQGTTTKEMLKNICISFSGGEVDIIEVSQEYRFIIKFVGTIGIPDNLNYLRESIEEIKPAHLAYSFEYTYNTWDMVRHLTWDEVTNRTWNQLREERL